MPVVERVERVKDAIHREGVIANIRLTNTGQLVRAFNSVLLGGISIFEIPIQAQKWADIVKRARAEFGDEITLGVGGVLDRRGALSAVQAGADYVSCPHTERGIVELCKEEGVVIMQGALTPNEVFRAQQTGADFVTVMPANFYGNNYVETLLFTYSDVKLIPTGGIDDKAAAQLLQSGARAVAIDTWLVNDQFIARRQFDEIQARAVALKKAAEGRPPIRRTRGRVRA
jgi:2-dehydro-3-deoxyphosphogluconate aldolase / (4S)-4-hydroxy-2-oxoglutarate aldolase